jgi:hypothetical protein
MAKMKADLRSLCRSYTDTTVRIVAAIAQAKESKNSDRLTASAMLWERGWGKAAQPHTGADGEGDIRITIRQILEGSGK